MQEQVKLGEPVFGIVDGFGCVVGFDENQDSPYLIHYANGREEREDFDGVRILREQLKAELKWSNTNAQDCS